MKFKLMLTSLVAVAFIAGYAHQGHTGEGHDHGDDKGSMMDHKMNEEGVKAVEVGNKICPVSGDKIEVGGKMGDPVKYEYKGKIYNLCCDMCVKDFKKDPEKYSKIADEEVEKSDEQEKNEEHQEGDGHEHHNHSH